MVEVRSALKTLKVRNPFKNVAAKWAELCNRQKTGDCKHEPRTGTLAVKSLPGTWPEWDMYPCAVSDLVGC